MAYPPSTAVAVSCRWVAEVAVGAYTMELDSGCGRRVLGKERLKDQVKADVEKKEVKTDVK